MSLRAERVAEEIRKVISERLIRGFKMPFSGLVTISGVEVNPDLTQAKVFYSVFGDENDVAVARKILEREKKNLRQEVGSKIRLRLTPELVFILDESAKEAARISELLNRNRPKDES
jgi:ribosome-binding factor A